MVRNIDDFIFFTHSVKGFSTTKRMDFLWQLLCLQYLNILLSPFFNPTLDAMCLTTSIYSQNGSQTS